MLIWCNVRMPESVEAELSAAVAPHQIIFSRQRTGNLTAAAADPQLADADIAFGQPDPAQVMQLPRLRWIHLSSAGYTRYDRADLRESLKKRKAILTNSSSVFDEPCAEHLLAFMLAQARALPQSFLNQSGPRAWRAAELRPQCRLLVGQSVLLLGFGAISRRLLELLTPLKMNILAIRQHPRGNEPIPIHPVSELIGLLASADHVINALPSNPNTDGLLGAKEFAAMKQGAIFYNIGRGTTVHTDALFNSLQSNHLGAAFLDVTDPEPLPPAHPLWQLPNCHITPHTGGGHIDEFARVVRHFLENLRRFETNEPLRDEVH